MTTTPAIVALVATLALGVAVGLMYLQRARRGRLKTLHLALALGATALVVTAILLPPAARAGGPPGFVPLLLLGASTAAGYFGPRIAKSRRSAELFLAAHIVLGIAGFFVFLAWAKTA
ncbi:hypothetical protein [Falsiroseomonas oryzae]|uniref:hypothetical protein n=1 Tax=Falsiroseomonas oryzae TaxID=2766473 RepID=UPI0022EB32FF|nr:hypothetical protein [Roseomonas sp. MO-31]